MAKTIAARLLDGLGVAYSVLEYPVELLDAVGVAASLGLPAASVFKTLVARGSAVVVACIPGPASLDLKALAAASGQKKVELVPVKEIQGLTGYIRGGVSPLGLRKAFPLFIDRSVLSCEQVSVSAGKRGLQLRLAGADLLKATGAVVADLVK